MKKLEVFDPAMCCSTGVCGVDVDPALVQFAADLAWVGEHEISVERHNLGQAPQAFGSCRSRHARRARWERASS